MAVFSKPMMDCLLPFVELKDSDCSMQSIVG